MNVTWVVTSLWSSTLVWSVWREYSLWSKWWWLCPSFVQPASPGIDSKQWDMQQRTLEQLQYQVLALSRDVHRLHGLVRVTEGGANEGDEGSSSVIGNASWQVDPVDQDFELV